MASQKTQKASRWGFLQQAVASVEAGLDTILAEDEQPTKKQTPTTARPSKDNTSSNRPSAEISRSGASTPANDRLQARLAKAMVLKGQSRPESPAPSTAVTSEIEATANNRDSIESGAESLLGRAEAETETEGFAGTSESVAPGTVKTISNTESKQEATPQAESGHSESQTASVRLSTDAPTQPELSSSARPSIESTNKADPAQLHSQLEAEASRQHVQEELSQYVERIDALQAKLKYLSTESAKAAHDVITSTEVGSTERKLAEEHHCRSPK